MGRRRKKAISGLTIDSVGDKGLGVARHEGKVVFVERTVPGDVVDVQVTKNRGKYSMAYPLEFLTLSPDRVEAFCSHFGTCGGCKWQSLPYEKQVEYKHTQVADVFRRIGHLRDLPVSPVVPAEKTQFYRNKLEFTFSSKRWLSSEEISSGVAFDDKVLGFHVPKFYDKILNITECFLQPEPSNAIRNFVRETAIELDIPFFDINQQVGVMRSLFIRCNEEGEFMLIVSTAAEHEGVPVLLERLTAKFPEIVSLYYVLNQKGNATISDLELSLVAGSPYLIKKVGALQFRLGPKSFFQTNTQQTATLYALVKEFAGLSSDDLVYDLYTGLGSIALYLADACKSVVGIELIEDAVVDARHNAELNGITNCVFHAGDMPKMLSTDFFASHGQPDVIITDPPRAGMHEKVSAALVASGARRIVYVSCNPATQARDLSLLSEAYDVVKLQPVDMFPHTYHIENIALLEKK